MILHMQDELYSYETLISDAKALSEYYHHILSCVTIGHSHDNRDIVLLKLGQGRKTMICCSGVHGRESVNPIILMRMIEYYALLYTGYKSQKEKLNQQLDIQKYHLTNEYEQMIFGACIYELLQTFTILVIPLLNPDGYMISLSGFDILNNKTLKDQCRNMKVPYQEWKFNGRGVDINRNFPCKLWRPKNASDYAASENETKALISVFHSCHSKGFLDIHSRGRMIYYHRSQMTDKYNERQRQIADRLKEITGYTIVPPENEIDAGDTGGNTVHYYSERFNKPALTIETVDEDASFPLDPRYREDTFEELKHVIFEFGSLII